MLAARHIRRPRRPLLTIIAIVAGLVLPLTGNAPASAGTLWSWAPSPFPCTATTNGCVSGTGFNPTVSTWGQFTNATGNCTNYVAYRLAGNGATRLTGSGDATTWKARVQSQFGHAAVNSTPAVGAIAWWAATSTNASGHVGYVEQVSGNTISISESVWNAGSRRRVLTLGQAGWPNAFLHIKDAPQIAGPLPRVAALSGGSLYVKEGPLNARWVNVGGGTSFTSSPKRVALSSAGELLVKEGPLNAPWVHVSGAGDAFEVTDNRVGVLSGGSLYVKEGSLNAPWVRVGGGTRFRMSPNRIAIDSGGKLWVKEGPLNAPWVHVSGAGDTFEVTDNRIGVLGGGQLDVKEGPLDAPWVRVGGGSAVDLS